MLTEDEVIVLFLELELELVVGVVGDRRRETELPPNTARASIFPLPLSAAVR